MTLVEMLIALAILATVILVTSSGIVQGLLVNRMQEEATNTQSKLRRITEVVAQDLRSAVLGGITNFPVPATSNGISFALLSGDGGFTVLSDGDFGVGEYTSVYSSDPDALNSLKDRPAVMLNGDGKAVVVPRVTDVTGSRIRHADCRITIGYDPATRVFSAMALGFDYDPDTKTLSQVLVDSDGQKSVPFAFGLSRFEIAYEYTGDDGTVDLRSIPWRDANGHPQPTFEAAGVDYELSRLRLTLATEPGDGELEREYVGYVELTGLGNSWRPVNSLTACGAPLPGDDPGDDDGDPGDDGGGPGDDGGDPGDDGGDGPGDDDDDGGPGSGGGGGDDDDDDCDKILDILCG